MKYPLEQTAAAFTGDVTRHLPQDLRSLPFASPVSARSPDIYLLWHPVYFQKHWLKLCAYHALLLVYKKIKGFRALLKLRTQFRYKLYGDVKESLLVSPALCGKEADGRWQTNYVKVGPQDALFVFGFGEMWGRDVRSATALSILRSYAYAWALALAGIRAAFHIEGSWKDKFPVLLLWLSWVVSFEWFEAYYFKQTLESEIKAHSIEKIACIHEMHGYARLIWVLAKQYGLSTYALQHASVTDGKRWYFALPQERSAGLELPQKMYVYEPAMVGLLKEYFPKTEFKLGLSWRYAHWQNVQPLKDKGDHVLFVSALAGFDNTVLIAVLKRLRVEGFLSKVHLRFHPLARLNGSQRRWIKSQTDAGWLVLTGNVPLKEDLAKAKVVVGMGTTVLEEALLLGRPVVHLQHADYVQYIHLDQVQGAWLVAWDHVTGHYLDSIKLTVSVDDIRHRFGLGLNIVDYASLFA